MKKTILYILPASGLLFLAFSASAQRYQSVYEQQNRQQAYQTNRPVYDDLYNPAPLEAGPLRPGPGGHYVSPPPGQRRSGRRPLTAGPLAGSGNIPAPLSYSPRSRFSKLPYSLNNYMDFKSFTNEPSPYRQGEWLNIYYGGGRSGLPSTPTDRSLMGTAFKGRSLSNPIHARSYYDTEIAGRYEPRQGPLSLEESFKLVRSRTGEPVTGPVNERLLQSDLFTGVQAVPRSELDPYAQQMEGVAPGDQAGDQRDYKLRRSLSGEEEQEQPQDRILRKLHKPWDKKFQEETARTQDRQQDVAVPPAIARDEEQAPEYKGMFTQMREAINRPRGEQAPVEGVQTELIFKAPEQRQGPITSFVGQGESEINKRLERAEELLAEGQYYKAADQYNFARVLDPENPLPRLGRAMAFLGAGNYMTSANNLFAAIQMFSPLAYFDLKMDAFMPDLRLLDRRRAELEQRLKSHEDFRLRFLLGFTEYYSGLKEIGLKDMQKAAEDFPEELAPVQRFVEILQRRQTTQPAD
jgi:hypothetical protein